MKSRSRLIVILLLLLALCLPATASAENSTWETVRGPARVSSVAYGNGVYVATQDDTAEVLLSKDGLTWNAQQIDAEARFWFVLWTGNEFVGATPKAVWTSPDGKSWQKRFTPPTGLSLTSLSTANGRIFITVDGTSSAFQVSADGGASWQRIDSVPLLGIVALGDRYIGIAGTAPGIWSSADGLTWQKVAGSDSFTAWDVVAGDDRVVVHGEVDSRKSQVWVSTDGQTWSQTDLPILQRAGSMAFYQGAFYMTSGPEGPRMKRSVDGLTWTPVTYTAPDSRGGRPSLLVSAGQHLWLTGTGYWLRLATDGSWSFVLPDRLQGSWNRVAWGAGSWVATGFNGQLFRSADGRRWERIDVGISRALTYVEWLGDRFIASSENTVVGSCREPGPNETCRAWILTSKDGLNWTKVQIDGPQITGAAASGETIVAVDWGWNLWRSADGGKTWTQLPRVDSLLWDDVTYHDGTYWALAGANILPGGVRPQAFLLTSTDGLNWQREGSFGEGSTFSNLTWTEGGLAVWDRYNILIGQLDSPTWQLTRPPMSDPNLRSLVFAEGYAIGVHYAPGNGDMIVQFKLGGKPSEHLTTPANGIAALAYHDGQFIAVGDMVQTMRVKPATACISRFADIPSAGNPCKAVEALAKDGVVGGYPDGTFRPAANVKRAEMAKLLVLAKGWQPAPAGALTFSDAAGHWAASLGYLQVAVGQQAITGFPDGTFQPEGTLTRAQLVKVVAAAAGLTPAGAPRFADITADAWYAGWVAAAESAHLIGARAPIPLWTEGRFEGELPATRLDAAILLYNLRQSAR